MDYQFREIRKGERAEVLDFARAHGSHAAAEALNHHLSLGVRAGGDLVGVALCVEDQGQYRIQVVHSDAFDPSLTPELTDRCLRKIQAEGIAAARITSPHENVTQLVWKHANWLDHIKETPPAEVPSEFARAEDQLAQPA